MIQIVEANDALLGKMQTLVNEVFPWQSFDERMSFWAYKHRRNPIVRRLTRLFGVSAWVNFWAAVNENGDVCGTTGLYLCPHDEDEAVWLSWFCVDPKLRGQGIGGKLIEFSIDQARAQNKQFLRLYTSDDPGETAAQNLYEKYGLKIVKEEKARAHTTIYRELRL